MFLILELIVSRYFSDKTGIYLHDMTGCEGSNDGQFYCPCGLAIDKYNRLIVCDVDDKRLQLFTLRGKSSFEQVAGRAFPQKQTLLCCRK